MILSGPALKHDFGILAKMLTTPVVLMGLADSGARRAWLIWFASIASASGRVACGS